MLCASLDGILRFVPPLRMTEGDEQAAKRLPYNRSTLHHRGGDLRSPEKERNFFQRNGRSIAPTKLVILSVACVAKNPIRQRKNFIIPPNPSLLQWEKVPRNEADEVLYVQSLSFTPHPPLSWSPRRFACKTRRLLATLLPTGEGLRRKHFIGINRATNRGLRSKYGALEP